MILCLIVLFHSLCSFLALCLGAFSLVLRYGVWDWLSHSLLHNTGLYLGHLATQSLC